MLALTVSRRATQGSILEGMDTPASILDLTVKVKMGTPDSTLEGMEILDSILDQAVMAKMETLGLTLEEMVTQGSMLASLGVWLLVLQGSEPPSSLLRTM